MKKILVSSLLLAMAGSAMASSATLDSIKQKGEIVFGYYTDAVPFSFVNPKTKAIEGYSKDVSDLIAKKVIAKGGVGNVKVRPELITLANRFDLVDRQEIHFECGITTHSAKREAKNNFTTTYFVSSMNMLVPSSAGNDWDAFQGSNIAIIQGSTAQEIVAKFSKDQKFGFNLIPFRTTKQAASALATGRVHGFILDDANVAGERTNMAGSYKLVGKSLSDESYGCTLLKGDDEFKALADEAISEALKNGEMTRLFKKWFQSPLPHNGKNMNLPFSEGMKKAFQAPNDKPLT